MKRMAAGGGNARAESGIFATSLRKRPPSEVRVLVAVAGGDERICRSLRALGYHVEAATDAASARELAARVMPDIALIELASVAFDGLELARELRALQGGEAVALVALAPAGIDDDPEANGPLSERRLDGAIGFRRVLCKPVELRRLEAALQELAPTETFTRLV